MRVITGQARGRKLVTLAGEDVRPTPDRVKEAVFSAIQFQVEGRRFLDLFAGSGQMGIEALSRGASQAVFVDKSREAAETVKKNLHACGLEQNARVLNMDSLAFLLQKSEPFGIAFLDPPYGSGLLQKVLPLVAELMAPGGEIFCECPVGEELPERAGDFLLCRRYRYGKISIARYSRKDVTEA